MRKTRVFGVVGVIVGLLVLVLVAFGCGGDDATTTTAGPEVSPTSSATTAPPETTTTTMAEPLEIKVALPGPAAMDHLGALTAWNEALGPEYKVVFINSAGIVESGQAAVTGEADVALAAVALLLNAIDKGATVKAVTEGNGMLWEVSSAVDLTEVKQLDGQPVGNGAEGQLTDALFKASIKKYGIEPVIVRSAQSEDRTSALLNGKLTASVGSGENYLWLESQKPGAFHTLLAYAKEYPEMGGGFYFANADFLADHPDAIQKMVTELIRANRALNDDPVYAAAQAKKYLPELSDEDIQKNVAMYLDRVVFSPTGHMDQATLEFTTNFYKDAGAVPSTIQISDWATPTFVEQALSELGQ